MEAIYAEYAQYKQHCAELDLIPLTIDEWIDKYESKYGWRTLNDSP